MNDDQLVFMSLFRGLDVSLGMEMEIVQHLPSCKITSQILNPALLSRIVQLKGTLA